VAVAVRVTVTVAVRVTVLVCVRVEVFVCVRVTVLVCVCVEVLIGVRVEVLVVVLVAVLTAVLVAVLIGVRVSVGVKVLQLLPPGIHVGVDVGGQGAGQDGVSVGVAVEVLHKPGLHVAVAAAVPQGTPGGHVAVAVAVSHGTPAGHRVGVKPPPGLIASWTGMDKTWLVGGGEVVPATITPVVNNPTSTVMVITRNRKYCLPFPDIRALSSIHHPSLAAMHRLDPA
jgi:hypothetical protein